MFVSQQTPPWRAVMLSTSLVLIVCLSLSWCGTAQHITSSASGADAHGSADDHRFVIPEQHKPNPQPPAAAQHAQHSHSHSHGDAAAAAGGSSESSSPSAEKRDSGGDVSGFHDSHGDLDSHAVALPTVAGQSLGDSHSHEMLDRIQENTESVNRQQNILQQMQRQIQDMVQQQNDPNRKIGPAGSHAHIRVSQTNLGAVIQIQQHSDNDHHHSVGEVDAIDSSNGSSQSSSSLASSAASDHLIHHGSHTHTLKDAEEHGFLIIATFICVLIAAQIGLIYWKRISPKAYQYTTLFALWSVPLFYSISVFDLLLFSIWFLFSAMTAFVLSRAIERPLQKTTPRFVYRYFFFVYQSSYVMAYSSFMFLLFDILGLAFLFFPSASSVLWSLCLMVLFYGLYFGVLSRDVAAYCTDQIASTLGYAPGSAEGEMPSRTLMPHVCAICDFSLTNEHNNIGVASNNNLIADLHRADAAAAAAADNSLSTSLTSLWKWMNGEDEDINAIVDSEPPITLACSHSFHLFCLKGWTMIGKKDHCPRCNEKVSLRQLFSHPWQKPSLLWSSILDVVRYIIAVNPLIVLVAQFVLVLVY